jgi:2,4-dienoyl-CoA reductase-like NADH-dependent reductase (Old Yellow Enzyme family)
VRASPNPTLFEPLTLPRGPAWPNRLVLAPLTNQQSHADGTLSDDEYRWLMMRAEGGFGVTFTCAAHVQAVGQGFPGQLGCFGDEHLPGLRRIADGIRARGSVSCLQLHHGGSRAMPEIVGQQVSVSDDAETGARGMTLDEVEQVRDDFITAAKRGEAAGFDGVEVHGAHGYLLTQFLSPELNRRTDRYGGSLDNRARLIFEIINGIRQQCRPDFQVGLRLSPERFGLKLLEVRDVAAEALRAQQIDYLDMSLWNSFGEPVEEALRGKKLMQWFTELPRGNIALGAAGKIRTARDALRALEEGCDFAMIGRAAIIAHDFANRARADAEYSPPSLPVSAEYLAGEGLAPAFIDYMRTWKGFVS